MYCGKPMFTILGEAQTKSGNESLNTWVTFKVPFSFIHLFTFPQVSLQVYPSMHYP